MNTALNLFIQEAAKISKPIVLELGTFQSIPGRSTLHKDFAPHYSKWIGSDIQAGPDVDIVADVHKLSKFIRKNSVDIIISCSSFEHFKYPHKAAFEMSKCLKKCGLIFVQTHHCFPLHAYPYDYFRFSTEALVACFGSKNGISVLSQCYEFPAEIKANEIGNHPDFLNSNLFAQKTHSTPRKYIYEFDTNLI